MRGDHEKVPLLASLGARVRALRLGEGLTVKELAQRAALSPRFINQLEAGLGNISVGGLHRVASAMNRSPVELIPPLEDDLTQFGQVWRLLYNSSDDDLDQLHQWLERRKGAKRDSRFVALIGLRGVGKSTIGPTLARELNVEFIEVDAMVEEAAGLSLAEIFNLHGEEYYRRLEQASLKQLLTRSKGCVLAPGGSVVNDVESWELIKHRCFTVWLHATPEALMKRMRKQGDLRPMQGRPSAKDELKALLTRRAPLYAESRLHIMTTRKTPEAIASQIVKALES
jgi:XRE family aerobic/anaerobic benzoate catabolism transcriptional regulator